ncbi:pilus assembly protein PilO [Nostoc sp. CMAA1605]|uniref:pilus assembly protein PilO n=1 Tax=Nostoc sp. CMAA1605 TaxID=2055159 RepID=UPI001F387D4D|nr:pilus assembly protein PilO [Nostoc sp. CMAA1605]MCF4966181.1 pilus assembly protein PilO [Nostoc sp. CMAA1605]
MTLSEDLNFAENAADLESGAPSYPVVFGIAFTPKIIGILVAVVGLAGAIYMLLNILMPAWEAYQQKQAQSNDLQGQIQQKQATVKQIGKIKEELDQAKKQKQQVLALFSDEKTLDTLLLDLNRLVESGSSANSLNTVKAKLQKFVPATEKPEIVKDGSLGVAVDGKLKRSSVNIEIIGTYEQTQSIIRNIERLQPLLIVKDYQSALANIQATDKFGKPVRRIGPAPITTSFQLQALMPLSPEELTAEAAKAAPKK